MTSKEQWSSHWTPQTWLYVLSAFTLMGLLEFPFVFFFDTILTNIGFLYIYLWTLPQATILYFTAFKLRTRWTTTTIMTLTGIIGTPIDYYFEWILQQNLLSPIHAIAYIPLYTLTGLAADTSLIKLNPQQKPAKASTLSSLIFTAAVLATTALAIYTLYPTPPTLNIPWITAGTFLIPYSLTTGAIGGYLGYTIARDLETRKEQQNSTNTTTQ